MTETNFFYWLQGYFELSGDRVRQINAVQLKCIAAHASMVTDAGDRMRQISSLLDFASQGLAEMDALTRRLRQLVAEQFHHVIDPTAGGPEIQAKLNELHQADGEIGSGPASGVTYRC